jgi:pimeloyl-ACP methyl ester carboxylesterase
MAAKIVIIHGWSDTSDSFHPMRDFLAKQGFDPLEIWLADYISLNDDVRVADVAQRMAAVLDGMVKGSRLAPSFDIICHSTGGLVVREWLASLTEQGKPVPVQRVVMLAPANFGSKLASIGKSMVGRIVKGWDNWFQTGTEMLSDLELGSPYSWALARRDLLDADGDGQPGPFGKGKVWVFVIIGTVGYSDGLHQIVNENGSDGTVRPCAANLNVVGMTVDFSADPANPTVAPWRSRVGAARIPFAVLPDRNHHTVTLPEQDSGRIPLKLSDLILEALKCRDDADYDGIANYFEKITEDTASLSSDSSRRTGWFGGTDPGEAPFHQYMQVVVSARDDQHRPVGDFFLEFYAPETQGDSDSVFFHTKVLMDVHTDGNNPAYRCLFLDHTVLMTQFYTDDRRQVAVSISAADPGPDVHYFNNADAQAVGEIIVHAADLAQRNALEARLRRNTTHLVELVLPRRPADDVFRLSQ